MQRANWVFLLVLYIGTFCSVLNADVEEPDLDQLVRDKKVFVEPTYTQAAKTESEYKLMPYRDRRHNWGFNASLAYSTYEPENYEPAFAHGKYHKIFGHPTVGMVEGVFTAKRNLSGMSIGGDLGVANFRNDRSDDTYVGSVLNLTELRIGGVIYFDTLISEDPLFVPYVAGGGYMFFYREDLLGNVAGGTTQVAPYVNGGIAMQLDWIDPRSARVAYEESSLIRSYLYLEARKYFTSQVKKDPDFGNSVSGALGVRCEF